MTELAVIRMPAQHPSPRQRLGGVLLVAAVAFVMAGAGPMLSWPRLAWPSIHPTSAPDAGRAQARPAGPDPEVAADAARHHVVPRPGHPGTLVATDGDYRVTFDGTGYSMAPLGSPHGLGVSLQAAERGPRDLGLTAGSWTSTSSGAERAVGSGLREVVSVRSGEVEWDVVVANAPAGRGDLVLTAGLAGAAQAHADGDGLRVSLAGGGQVRVGALVVKDATGRVLHRAVPSVEGRWLQLVVPDHVLAGARYPLTLDPTVGPEKKVSGASQTQTTSDIAFDGTNYLVVWTDYRNGVEDIYGARVQPDGTVLDPGGFPISTSVGIQNSPVVGYSGRNFLVVWTDYRSGANNGDIYGSTVTGAGVVIDTGGAAFSTAPGTQALAALAFNGTSALVVWQDDRSSPGTGAWDIYGSRWSATAGGLLDPLGIPISTEGHPQYGPAVSYYGPNYLVVWQDTRSGSSDIYATRVTTAGGVLDGAGVAFSTAAGVQSNPSLAFDGSYVLIVWADNRSAGSGYDLFGARWDPATGLIDQNGLAISTAAGDQAAPSVTADGGFLVLWEDHRTSPYRIYGTRVGHNGSLPDGAGFLVNSPGGYAPAITNGGSGKWGASYGHDGGIFFRKMPK